MACSRCFIGAGLCRSNFSAVFDGGEFDYVARRTIKIKTNRRDHRRGWIADAFSATTTYGERPHGRVRAYAYAIIEEGGQTTSGSDKSDNRILPLVVAHG